MKRLLLAIALVCSIGCPQPKSKPDMPARFAYEQMDSRGVPFWAYMLTDTETGKKYIVVRAGHGVSICPAGEASK